MRYSNYKESAPVPFPRFDKLPQEKRERLLGIAAQEFAKHGFADGSVNRILERAQISKGAAYYYFEDKIDLFFTVVQYGNERLKLINQEVDSAALTEENFWTIFADLHREPLLRSFEEPWLFAAIKAAGRLSPAVLEREPLATFAKQIINYVMTIVKRGQEIGVVRTDIPDELIFAWLQALDDIGDRWLLAHWEHLDLEAVAQVSDQTVDAIRRVLAP
jgi:AcrR family transcriptional regulator